MSKENYKENLEKIKPYFNETKHLKVRYFIPSYFLKQLYLPSDQVDFDLFVENIERKIQRDWLYHTSFMKIVDIVSELGTCSRRKVGAVLIKNRRILATGFNGTPPGSPHCNDVICPGRNSTSGSDLSLCAAVHAEENCLLYCAKYSISPEKSTLYCSCEPCDDCMKLIETVGIKTVIYRQPYPTKMSVLRQYFKARTISFEELAKEYWDFTQNRINSFCT